MASITLKNIAEHIMLGNAKTSEEFNDKIKGQWGYRSNKSISDVNLAVEKGLKLGKGKAEREIECIAMYLESVLKKVKVVKKEKVNKKESVEDVKI